MNEKIRGATDVFHRAAQQKYYSVYCTKSYYNISPVTLISIEILLLCKPIKLMFKFFDKKIP